MARYKDAVAWIAWNDSPGDSDSLDPEVVGYLVSSVLVADVWGKSPAEVGRDVVEFRKRNKIGALDN